MSDPIFELLDRWFEFGDELAYRRAYERLAADLRGTRDAVAVLGAAVIDELRQDVLQRLLNRETGHLRKKDHPLAYARATMRRAIVSELRKWGPRASRAPEVEQHLEELGRDEGLAVVEARLDAERALEIAAALPLKGRMAVLLMTRPDRISDDDWASIVDGLPPPPPSRPREPLDRDEASCLLFPPDRSETTEQGYQRRNSFDKTYKRAVAKIREALEEQS